MFKIFTAVFAMLVCSPAMTASLEFKEVGEGIYVHHGQHLDISEGYQGDICNLSFVVGSNGIAVIDTGGSLQVGKQVLAAIRKVSNKPILFVINTHIHPDHIFGNAAFKNEQAKFVGHAKLADAMELRKEAYIRTNTRWLGEGFAGSEIVKPDIAVTQTQELDLGDRVLQVTAYPTAHTNTDITVMDSKTSTLWTGDLLVVERTPSMDGDIKGWIKVVDMLKTQTAAQAVPGHGPVQKDWKAALDKELGYFNALLNDIRTHIKQGLSMEKSMDQAAASEKANWVLFDVVNRRNVNILYPALEWE